MIEDSAMETCASAEKKKLRQEIKRRKAAVPIELRRRYSEDILRLLENHTAFQQARRVLLYHSLPDEVDTHSFIERYASSKTILLPAVVGDKLELRVCSPSVRMVSGSYGIKEPLCESFTDYSSIDLAIIPGVAFDAHGGRLGRGKGYYDKLLPLLSCHKIGLCFPFQMVDHIPVESHDILMDEVLTLW